MKLKTLLTDVVKQCSFDKVEVLSVKPEDGVVTVKTFDEDRMLIINAASKEGCDDVVGHFGLSNFRMLSGLISTPSFDGEDSMSMGTRTISDEVIPDRILFKGKGSRATFRLINKEVLPDMPSPVKIAWDAEFEPTEEKAAEFKHMAGLYQDVDGNFVLRTEKGNLVADFGVDSSSTHSGSMILAEDVGADITGELRFSMARFLQMLKISAGLENRVVRITGRGLLNVSCESHACTYDYFLKKKMT